MIRALAIAALLVGCGSPPPVGDECSASDPCSDGLRCDLAVPGGYCTQSCPTPGATEGCPEESVCDAVTGTAQQCVKICSTKDDCRADLDCNGITGSNIKACKPKP